VSIEILSLQQIDNVGYGTEIHTVFGIPLTGLRYVKISSQIQFFLVAQALLSK